MSPMAPKQSFIAQMEAQSALEERPGDSGDVLGGYWAAPP